MKLFAGTAAALAMIVPVLLAPLADAAPVKPYVTVNGGDIMAGVQIRTDAGNPCPAAPDTAGIVSWNNQGAPDFGGAGAEYAAYARGYIQSFVTGQANTVGSPKDASQLAFANTANGAATNPAKGLFGGMFGAAPSDCIEYWGDKPTSGLTPINAVQGITGMTAGNYTAAVPQQTITGGTVAAGQQISIYVDGDVLISGDIRYIGGTYTDRSQIPSFRLIVRGTIYIQPNVTQLDGVYAAIPKSTNSGKSNFSAPQPGTISTCSNGFQSYDPTKILTVPMDACKTNKLDFFGSVVAQQIWLLRSVGSLGAAPAETFNYVPEMWLAPSSAAGTGTTATPDYQSIIGLPPVL